MSEIADGLTCKYLVSSTGATLETVINAWIATQSNAGKDITIKYISLTEGTIGGSLIKAFIFYNSDYTIG